MGVGDRAADFWFLVRGRAEQFSASFDAVLAGAGIEAVKIPPRSPRANAYAERFVLTARTEVTERMMIFSVGHLRTMMAQYSPGSRRRPHRALQLQPPRPDHLVADLCQEQIKRRPRGPSRVRGPARYLGTNDTVVTFLSPSPPSPTPEPVNLASASMFPLNPCPANWIAAMRLPDSVSTELPEIV